ncbi:NAD+ synthase [bacterium]|nr:NAD+ synthase [bacterium]
MIRIGLAQFNAHVGDIPGNAGRIAAIVRDAEKRRVDVLLFPELAVSGYPPEDLLLKPHFVRACEAAVIDIARACRRLVAIVGAPILRADVHNAAFVLAGGEVAGVYRKIHLPNYGVFDERRYFAPGDEGLVLAAGEARLGLTVCEDIWIGDGPHVDEARAGAQAILNISASPFHAKKTQSREQMLAQRAADHGAFLAFCNLVGGQDELVFDGASCVIDPDGRVIARAPCFAEALLIVDIDPRESPRGRLRDPRLRGGRRDLQHVERPVVTREIAFPAPRKRASAKPAVAPIPDEIDVTQAALETGLSDYVRKNGFANVVIGLSGGVDSAYVAALACRALSPEKVLGVFMPSPYSSGESRADARRLAKNLGMRLVEIPIHEAMESYDAMLAGIFKRARKDQTEENIQARIRGMLLMAVSNKLGHLVLATGNKSEMSCGYATLYGDMCGGFAPIKDVSKTTIYALCERLNARAGRDMIPANIIEKAPTAELRPGQRDTDTLPEYAVLDRILSAYVEEEKSYGEIVEAGFDADVVAKVIRMVNASEYKRRQAAPGIKVTPLAFGKDRRLPITNGYAALEVGARPATKPKRPKKAADA